MATYTDNYTMTKPTYAEQADISVINANMDIIDNVMHSSQISLAPAYDINETYNTGDIVMHELLMYKCLEDNVTGAWDSTKWERTTASETGGGADLDIYGEASGTAEASFSDGAEAGLVECEIGIVPTQDLHGYSKPWAGGGGKNKVEYPYRTTIGTTWNGMSISDNNGLLSIVGVQNGATRLDFCEIALTANTTYTLSSNFVYDDTTEDRMPLTLYDFNTSTLIANIYSGNVTFTVTENHTAKLYLNPSSSGNTQFYKFTVKPMIEVGSVATSYEPYSNICPISGHTDVTITVASTSGGSGDDTTVSLGRTVYGGKVDVATGELVVNKASSDLGDLSWVKSAEGRFQSTSLNGIIAANTGAEMPNMECSVYEVYRAGAGTTIGITAFTEGGTSYIRCIDSSYADAPTFTNGVRGQTIVYELATPQTFTLSKEQIQTLLGQNYVSHDGGGTISLVYVKGDAPIKPNPADAEIPLTGLEINGEKFKIESGGYHKALLWDSGSPTTGASYATDYALLDNLSNYNQIILMVSTTGDRADPNHQYSYQIWLDVEYLLSSGAWHNVNVAGYGTRYFEASFTDSSFRIIQGGGEGGYTLTIFQIYGVRY